MKLFPVSKNKVLELKTTLVMNRAKLFPEIKQHLEILAITIEHSNRLNLTDAANYAEDLFARVLSSVFKCNLVNLNTLQINADTIDLVDTKKHIGIQVTSNQSFAAKKRKTLSGFKKSTTHKGIKKLIILYITSKQVAPNVLKSEVLGDGRVAEGYDIVKLLLEIKTFTPARLQSVLKILQEELIPLKNLPAKADLKQLQELQPKNDCKGVQINRGDTLLLFKNTCLNRNLMLIGQPGVGKSYLLNAFNEQMWTANNCCVLFQIDKLATGSKEELSRLLNTKDNWIDFLSTLDRSKPCYLIFDAYDTARGTSLSENILERIAEAISGLPNNWKVIASVRTFDAKKSPKLNCLFKQDSPNYTNTESTFELGLLTHEELEITLGNAPELKVIFEACDEDLKNVLRVPFFLKIFEEVVLLSDADGIVRLKGIITQEQLLDIYWERKINVHEQETTIERVGQVLAEQMFASERLNVERRIVLPLIDGSALDLLRAEGIVVDIQADRLAFQHNILFDYVVARLVIAKSPDEFVRQINDNLKAPFIFRPSYWIFVHRLWRLERSTFWALYHHIWEQDGITFRLLHQLIFNSIIISNLETVDDLKPLFATKWKARYGNYTLRLLDALRFANTEKVRKQDIELIEEISKDIRIDFLWHLGSLIMRAQKDGYKEQVAKPAILFMKYILKEREVVGSNIAYLDQIAGSWGIEAVCNLSVNHKADVISIVNTILGMLSKDDFPISYFRALEDSFILLLTLDADIAIKVFSDIYAHNETSQATTSMGNSSIMNFTSNRRQDFEMCKYGLEQKFSEFLAIEPYRAISVVINLMNILKNNNFNNASETVPVIYRSISTTFKADGSVGDWAREHQDGIGKLLQESLEFIKNQFLSNAIEAEGLLTAFIREASTGYVWKELLKMFTHHPQTFYKHALSLLKNEIFYLANETTYEVGELIKAITPYAKEDEIDDLEEYVIELSKSPIAQNDSSDFLKRRIAKTLSCFPQEKLKCQISRDILFEHKGIENQPIITYSGIQSVVESEEERQERLGIKPDCRVDNELYQLQNSLAKCLEEAGKPAESSTEQKDKIANDTFHLFERIANTNELAEGILHECEETVAQGVYWISRTRENLSEEQANQCFQICRRYLEKKEEDISVYDVGKMSGMVMAYNPTPRKTISQSLRFLASQPDIEGFGVLLSEILIDNDPVVRGYAMNAISYFYINDKESFWKWILLRSQDETDSWCLTILLTQLCWGNILREEKQKVETVLGNVVPRIVIFGLSSNATVVEQFVHLVLGLIEVNNSKVAKSILAQNRNNKGLQRVAISRMTEQIALLLRQANLSEEQNQLLEYYSSELIEIVSAQFTTLHKVGVNNDDSKELFGILDFLAQRIYYTLLEKGKDTTNKESTESHYQFYKPIIDKLLTESSKLNGGLLLAGTAFYASQYLELCLSISPSEVLRQVFEVVRLANAANFANDKQTLTVIVSIVEKYLADHREILLQKDHFQGLLETLGTFADSGWQEALVLVWKLNEIFT